MRGRCGVMSAMIVSQWMLGSNALAGHEVIFSSVSGQPTTAVPLGPALAISAQFSNFSRAFRSPNGERWIMQASTDLLFSENRVLMTYDGVSWSTVVREGLQAPWAPAGELVGFFETRMAVNDSGQFCFSNNTDGGPDASDQYLVKFDGSAFVVAAQENQPAIGGGAYLFQPAGMCITNSGDVGFHAYTTLSSRVILGASVIAESGVTVPSNQADGNFFPIVSFGADTLTCSPSGSNTLYRATVDGPFAVASVLVRNGRCVLRTGDVIAGLPQPVNFIALAWEDSAGSWLARGGMTNGDDFVLRDGLPFARTDAPIAAAATETFNDNLNPNTFFLCRTNNGGDIVIGGWTNQSDPLKDGVLILNNQGVIAREGDRVDVDDDGIADDDAFILRFQPDNAFLTSDVAVVNVDVRNSLGNFIGQAVLRIPLEIVLPCPGDTNNDGTVGVADLLAVIAGWGPCAIPGGCTTDVNGDGVIGVADLLGVIAAWGACP